MPVISGIVPGVMAQTGMESAEILKGIIHETKPNLIIAIDALAARSVKRLGTTIQLTDTGIHPGSGVGNHRHSLTRESLGVPVMAIGVPTVVGAAAIVQMCIRDRYLLYGDEAFLKNSYKNQMRAAISGDDTMNYNYFEGKGLDLNLSLIHISHPNLKKHGSNRGRRKRSSCLMWIKEREKRSFMRPKRRTERWFTTCPPRFSTKNREPIST